MKTKETFEIEKILKIVSEESGIPIHDMRGKSHKREVVEARHSFYILCDEISEHKNNKVITDAVCKDPSTFYYGRENEHIQSISRIVKRSKRKLLNSNYLIIKDIVSFVENCEEKHLRMINSTVQELLAS